MSLKCNKAITLVALIITIIILLILAGVTLSMVLGDNGLINKAQSSIDKYQESSDNEQGTLNEMEDYITLIGSARIISYTGITIETDKTGTPELIIDGKCTSKKFKSSNPEIATVDASTGEVTAVKGGTTTITATITDYLGEQTSKSCIVTVIYSIGKEVTVSGKSFNVIADNGDTVTLLYKSTIGTGNWNSVNSQASSFGSSLGGTGRLLTYNELEALPMDIRACGKEYYLGTWRDGSTVWYVTRTGYTGGVAYLWYGNSSGARPVVIMSKSRL